MQDISEDNAAMDSIYKHDKEEQKKLIDAAPWATEYRPFTMRFNTSPHHFKKIRISAVALIKMVILRKVSRLTIGDACSIGWKY